MRAEIKSQISPGSKGLSSKEFITDKKPIKKNEATDNTSDKKADFKSLILNSENDIKQERQKIKSGDFSGAKSDEEFLEKLQDANKPKIEPKNKMDKDSFLKLFVAQLKNQDPLNPDDGAQMASKLAQFHGLEEMINVNKNLSEMFDHQKKSSLSSKIDFVGKEVEIEDSRIKVLGENKHNVSYEIDKDAANVSIEIKDSSGKLVFTKSLGPVPAGKHEFLWQGKNNEEKKVPDGIYNFGFNVTDKNNIVTPAKSYTKTSITGIDLNSKEDGVFSPLGKIKTEAIKSIGLNGYKKANDSKNPEPKTPELSKEEHRPLN